MRNTPRGRGWYIWHLPSCCGGDVDALIAHCAAHGITWLAIKWLANKIDGKWVQQFTPQLVARLQSAGIAVWGWHYDVPGHAADQAANIQAIHDAGATGYVSDCEIEWEQDPHPDAAAADFVAAVQALNLRPNFGLAHAPFDVIGHHAAFPYTTLGRVFQTVCPQAYWPEHGMSEAASTARCLDSFARYRAQHPDACCILAPSGYSVAPDLAGGHTPTPADLLHFEATCAAAGCPAVLHWRFDGTPDAFWAAIAGTSYPDVATNAAVCADVDAAAPGC